MDRTASGGQPDQQGRLQDHEVISPGLHRAPDNSRQVGSEASFLGWTDEGRALKGIRLSLGGPVYELIYAKSLLPPHRYMIRRPIDELSSL